MTVKKRCLGRGFSQEHTKRQRDEYSDRKGVRDRQTKKMYDVTYATIARTCSGVYILTQFHKSGDTDREGLERHCSVRQIKGNEWRTH